MHVRQKLVAGALALGLASSGVAQAPFGDPESVAYADKLWSALESSGLAGDGAVVSKAYEGREPHGAVLDTIDATLTIDGHTGAAIVKRNYGGEGVSVSKVADAPGTWLKAVTVMFKRESGYDLDNADWFWAKFLPDGALDKNATGMALAGRVAKGAAKGCIACHRAAPGGDYVFNHDRYAR